MLETYKIVTGKIGCNCFTKIWKS